jgi:two-component system, LytTR family, response regulator AlgR
MTSLATPSSFAVPLRVVVADDEPLARARLKMLLSDLDRLRCEVVGECGSAAEVDRCLATQTVDCVLLDIQMPGTTGLELASAWQQASDGPKPAVIFVTAHDQHALKAFELAAADYLTKPVRRERLQSALERVLRQRAPVPDAPQPVLVASERGRVARIPVSDVLYLKAELKYVTLRTAERTWVLDESLTELENRLSDAQRFLRVHRNALVCLDAVTGFEKRVVVGDDEAGDTWAVQVASSDEWLAVSRRQLSAVREAVMHLGLGLPR